MTRQHDSESAWYQSVADVGRDRWNRCFDSRGVLRSFDLALAVERGQLPDIHLHYLAQSSGNDELITPVFQCDLQADVLAGEQVQRWVSRVRRFAPGAVRWKALVVGSPLALCTDVLGFSSTDPVVRRSLWQLGKTRILDLAEDLDCPLVVFKEIEPGSVEEACAALGQEFAFVPSLPSTYVPTEFDGMVYPDLLRAKYRTIRHRRMRRFRETGLHWETVSDFEGIATTLYSLYMQVRRRAASALETLTPRFFEEVSRQLGPRSFVDVAFSGDEVKAFELYLEDEHAIHPLYLGLDYDVRDQASLYYNCLYRIIDQSARLGHAVVELGQTAYESKALLGAFSSQRHLAIRHRSRAGRFLLRRTAPWFYPQRTLTPRRVWREPDSARAHLEDCGATCDFRGVERRSRP